MSVLIKKKKKRRGLGNFLLSCGSSLMQSWVMWHREKGGWGLPISCACNGGHSRQVPVHLFPRPYYSSVLHCSKECASSPCISMKDVRKFVSQNEKWLCFNTCDIYTIVYVVPLIICLCCCLTTYALFLASICQFQLPSIWSLHNFISITCLYLSALNFYQLSSLFALVLYDQVITWSCK